MKKSKVKKKGIKDGNVVAESVYFLFGTLSLAVSGIIGFSILIYYLLP